jgi:YidC/Oxa1 family membrane protein insertase
MPIFLALFNVMRNPYKYIPTSSDLYAAFCTNGAGKVVGEAACSKSPLPNHLEFLGMDLSQHATGVSGGFLDALPYFILVGLVIVTGFMQARQSKRNAPNMNSQMAMVTQILPIGFGLFSLQFPAGLVLYYFVSNLWRLGQQEIIMRKITRPGREQIEAAEKKRGAIDVKGSVATDAPPDDKKPGGLRRLFQPAAPPENGNAESAGNGAAVEPARKTPTSRSGATSGRSGKPQGSPTTAGGQRRKNNKRKRKR